MMMKGGARRPARVPRSSAVKHGFDTCSMMRRFVSAVRALSVVSGAKTLSQHHPGIPGRAQFWTRGTGARCSVHGVRRIWRPRSEVSVSQSTKGQLRWQKSL